MKLQFILCTVHHSLYRTSSPIKPPTAKLGITNMTCPHLIEAAYYCFQCRLRCSESSCIGHNLSRETRTGQAAGQESRGRCFRKVLPEAATCRGCPPSTSSPPPPPLLPWKQDTEPTHQCTPPAPPPLSTPSSPYTVYSTENVPFNRRHSRSRYGCCHFRAQKKSRFSVPTFQWPL